MGDMLRINLRWQRSGRSPRRQMHTDIHGIRTTLYQHISVIVAAFV